VIPCMNLKMQALSYYKIFGYPTGLGALLVHKRAVPALMKRKRYFGGGTVAASLAEEDFFRWADLSLKLLLFSAFCVLCLFFLYCFWFAVALVVEGSSDPALFCSSL